MHQEDLEKYPQVVTAIEDLYAIWMDAIRTRDLDGLLALYSDDAVYMPQGKPRSKGVQAIRMAWEGHFQRQDFRAQYVPTLHVARSEDLVYDIGSYLVSFTRNSEKIEVRGKYVVVWRNLNGSWKIAVDIDNTDA